MLIIFSHYETAAMRSDQFINQSIHSFNNRSKTVPFIAEISFRLVAAAEFLVVKLKIAHWLFHVSKVKIDTGIIRNQHKFISADSDW